MTEWGVSCIFHGLYVHYTEAIIAQVICTDSVLLYDYIYKLVYIDMISQWIFVVLITILGNYQLRANST